MDRDALVARCETRYQDSANDLWTAAEWASYVDDAYSEVLAYHPRWPFLEARATNLVVSAGANTVDLPDGVWRVAAVFNATNGFPMSQIDGRGEYRQHFPDATPGHPSVYQVRANTLEVFPYASADTTLHVDHFVHPAGLDNGTDEPIFPRPYHRILVDGALALAYTDDGNSEAASLAQQRFVAGIERLKDDLFDVRTEFYPIVQDIL